MPFWGVVSNLAKFWCGKRLREVVMSNERLTGAMLDRLTHKVHIIEANGDSYRLEQSRKRLARQKKRTDQN